MGDVYIWCHPVDWAAVRRYCLRLIVAEVGMSDSTGPELPRLVGPWQLAEKLGKGGNATVYRASRDDGRSFVALKVVRAKKPNSERFKRFLSEVSILARLNGRPGILPMLDHSTEEGADEAWMAMPIATPIADALRDGFVLDEVIAAAAEIARTLATLHDEGISHRDIKPQNLYRLDRKYVIGDFGLVDFPEKESLTAEGRKLGPQNFLAPEMLSSSEMSHGKSADVYSLAKTLWVLVADQRWPPPGELRLDTPGMRMTDLFDHPRLGLLDPLVARATRHAPEDRPTMRDFAMELEAWLAPPVALGAEPDLVNLAARLRVATGDAFRSDDQHKELRGKSIALTRKFAKRIQATLGPLVETAEIRCDTTVRNLGDSLGEPPPMPGEGKAAAWNEARWLRVQTPNDVVTLCCGSRLLVLEGGRAYARAAFVLTFATGAAEMLWHRDYATFNVGGLGADRVVELLARDLLDGLHAALETFTLAVEGKNG